MGIEKRTYGRNQRQTIGDVIKGFGIIALGASTIYISAELKKSLRPENQFLTPHYQTDWMHANYEEFKKGVEKTAADALPYVLGGIGVLTMIGGVARVVNRTYRP